MMTHFNLFDTVKLTQDIVTGDNKTIPKQTIGTIVEVYNQGEAYDVELLGDWVEYDCQGDFIASQPHRPNAFVETVAVETLTPNQFVLVKSASQTVGIRAQLLAILDELSEDKLTQVRDFAQGLR